ARVVHLVGVEGHALPESRRLAPLAEEEADPVPEVPGARPRHEGEHAERRDDLRPAWAALLAEERVWSGHRSVVGVQRLVERDALTGPVAGLDATGDRVAQEEESAAPGELSRLDDVAGGQAHLRAGGDVEARL